MAGCGDGGENCQVDHVFQQRWRILLLKTVLITVFPWSVMQILKEILFFVLFRSYAKGFGAMGALFAGSEARHDMYNSIYAGCTTGAILAHSGGPKAMCIGCASFAAFSAVIDKFMGH